MKEKSLFLSFLIFLSVFSWVITGIEGQVETEFYLDPPVVTAIPGGIFTANVKVAKVKTLYTYQFKLKWEPSLLDVTSVTEGPFLNAEGTYKTYFDSKIWNSPDPLGLSGYTTVYCTLLGEPATAAASGDGTLATIEFLVKEEGNTSLHLYDTKLLNDMQVEMSHETEDGYFQSAPPPEISVEPSNIVDASLLPGNAFTININVIQAVDVYAWSLNMSWDPALLNVTDVEEGFFLNQGAYNTTFNTQIHQEEGHLYTNCSLFGEPPDVSASGNGTLISISFLVESVGISVLDLYDSKLFDYGGAPILHVSKDGYFENSGERRDVSIISVEASPSIVRTGDSVSITVIAMNEGTATANFDVTVYFNNSNLGTLSIYDLEPDAEKTLAFSTSTEGLAEANYTVKAVASTVLWETDTDDNTYVNGYVMVTPPPEQTFTFIQILVVVVIILIVVAVTSVMLLRKRR